MQVKIYKRNIYRIFIHMSVYQKVTFQNFFSDSRPTHLHLFTISAMTSLVFGSIWSANSGKWPNPFRSPINQYNMRMVCISNILQVLILTKLNWRFWPNVRRAETLRTESYHCYYHWYRQVDLWTSATPDCQSLIPPTYYFRFVSIWLLELLHVQHYFRLSLVVYRDNTGSHLKYKHCMRRSRCPVSDR